MVKPVEILAESPYTVVYGALVMTPAMLLRLINCRFIIIIIITIPRRTGASQNRCHIIYYGPILSSASTAFPQFFSTDEADFFLRKKIQRKSIDRELSINGRKSNLRPIHDLVQEVMNSFTDNQKCSDFSDE